LDPERVAAWWMAMEPFVADMRSVLIQQGVLEENFSETKSLKPMSVSQVASVFGVDESVGTAVYTELSGDVRGLLMFASPLPATKAIEVGTSLFQALARGTGGQFDEPWALVDMRSTLATSLAAQTGSLDLGAMVQIDWHDMSLCFIPDWAQWCGKTQMDLREEAA
jgi:hypothetical protein